MRFIFILFLVFILNVSAVEAAPSKNNTPPPVVNIREVDMWKRSMVTETERYNQMVDTLFKERKGILDQIYGIRSRYPRTEYYNPFSKSLVETISSYAYIVDTSEDKVESNHALVKYNDFLKQHIVDLGVVSFARMMSQSDVRFGDEYFLKEVEDAIKKSIKIYVHRTNGETAEQAYHIVSYSEETEVLRQIGGVVKKSELFDVKGKYYNVHDMEKEDGEFIQIFIDVTEPIKATYMKQLIDGKGSVADLPPSGR